MIRVESAAGFAVAAAGWVATVFRGAGVVVAKGRSGCSDGGNACDDNACGEKGTAVLGRSVSTPDGIVGVVGAVEIAAGGVLGLLGALDCAGNRRVGVSQLDAGGVIGAAWGTAMGWRSAGSLLGPDGVELLAAIRC